MKFHLILFIFCIKLLNAQECGVVKVAVPFIAGGDYAERGQWPWLAPLFLKEKDKFFCGSTIISKRHLLSGEYENRNFVNCKIRENSKRNKNNG